MVVPELSLMNINHRYYSIETFFKAAGEAGYRNIELWTGSMHLYVDCHEHDSVDKIRDLAAQYGIKIVCVCPEKNNTCLLYTSPSPRDGLRSRMPSSA